MPVPQSEPAPFTPAMAASKGLQAEHSRSDDSPTDVNNNSALARVQAQTSTLIGAELGAAAARRTIIADQKMPDPAP